MGWCNLVCFFLIILRIWFINLNFRNALNRASVVPNHTARQLSQLERSHLNIATVALVAAEVGADVVCP